MLASPGIARVELVKLRKQDGGLQLRKGRKHVAAVLVQAGTLVDIGLACQQSAAASRAEQLGTAEAQNACIAPGAGFTALHERSRHLRGVPNYAEIVPGRQVH